MFGTLVSTDFDQGTLEFIENPDPVAAVSRNLQEKIHISCMFCRSRKVRCSGGRKSCQRCVTMGIECVYPENQGRNKRQESNKNRRAQAIQHTPKVSTRTICNDTEPSARSSQGEYGEELAFDDLHGITFNDSCIDQALCTPWLMDTPMQHNSDARSSSSSIRNSTSPVNLATSESSFSARSRSATVVTPGQLPELSTADTSFTSLLSPSATDSAGDLEPWEGPHTAHGDIAWAMNSNGDSTVHPSSETLCLQHWSKPCTESEGCYCLLSSISFLERLVSRSASRENRIGILFADVRNSIETLEILIACERCAARVEQNMLLAMAARQISVMCRKTANCYKAMHLCGLSDKNSSQQKAKLDSSAGLVDISVSTYCVNRREKLHLLESLVTLQIVDFQKHVNTIKSRFRDRPNRGQAEALVEAENHIKLAQVAISGLLSQL